MMINTNDAGVYSLGWDSISELANATIHNKQLMYIFLIVFPAQTPEWMVVTLKAPYKITERNTS